MIDITVLGIDQAKAKLAFLSANVMKEGVKVVGNGCRIVETRASEIITEKRHVVTGNLRRSISSKAEKAGLFLIDGACGVDSDKASYAPYVESLPDGGYLFPAYYEKYREVMEFIGKGIKEIVDKSV